MSPIRSFTRSISSGGGGGSGTVTNVATTSPISGGPITTTGTLSLLVNVNFAFTAGQTITAPAGSTALTLTGGTQTVSNPVVNATQTWNAGAVTFTGLLLNVTDTASAAQSLFLDLQTGGVSQFRVNKTGRVTMQGGILLGAGPNMDLSVDFNGISIRSGDYYGFSVSASNAQSTPDCTLFRDAANTLALRNDTVSQAMNVYNTFTSATNFERLMFDWKTTANVAMIYTQVGSGGGIARVLQLNYGGTTTSAISIPITSGTLTFGGALTTTGVSAIVASGTAIPAGGTAGTGYRFSSTANYGIFFGSGAPTLAAAQGSLYLRSDGTSTSTRAYINTDGGTTWTSITTAA